MTDFQVSTRRAEEWINITASVQKVVSDSSIKEGACLVSIPHTTAGCTIQENADPDVVRDCLMALERIVPADWPYRHGEGNSTAHIKTSLVGSSVTVPIRGGRLVLGTWQSIYLCEFDGPRTRRAQVDLLAAH